MNGTKTQVPILPIEMDGRRFRTRLDLPKVGEHTREILDGLGYDRKAISDMTSKKIISA
jgi:crotonobetainyl-CoA:carnitine CoA-transferase CaiB-like acyl-CoA transferase